MNFRRSRVDCKSFFQQESLGERKIVFMSHASHIFIVFCCRHCVWEFRHVRLSFAECSSFNSARLFQVAADV